MAKSREKTQQIGFWDNQVASSDHDSICLWAYDNADFIVRSVCPDLFDYNWKQSDFPIHDDKCKELLRSFIDRNPRPNPRVVNRTIEYVLRSYTGYNNSIERIVGYADLLIDVAVPCISSKYDESERTHREPQVQGFEINWAHEGSRVPKILVEAKSALPTVGELMRQIQLYRTAFKGHFVVISPDESYAKLLAEQGVFFIRYPGAAGLV